MQRLGGTDLKVDVLIVAATNNKEINDGNAQGYDLYRLSISDRNTSTEERADVLRLRSIRWNRQNLAYRNP